MSLTDEDRKHPFYINCMNCGSNNVSVYMIEDTEVEIRCNRCMGSIKFEYYNTIRGDYSKSWR